jgi:flagellar basal-body rod modification protein FlgD
MTTAVTSTKTLADLTAPKTKTTKSDSEESQDRFLKLLVAQLNNQDPMNPMDNAQTTSQMAQINTVSGIQTLNESVKSLTSQFTSMQMLQGTQMVGRDVLLQSNTLSVENGQAKGAIDLSGRSDAVTLNIQTAGGQTIDSINLGAMEAGRHEFSWDASAYPGNSKPNFTVASTLSGQEVSNTTFARDKVASVGLDNGSMTVQLQGRSPVSYSDIKAIL